jgi:hypothetical protein
MRWLLAALSCGVVRALHASLAYPSARALPPLPVKQVCIDCKNPADNPTQWRDEIRKRAARRGCGYREGAVVFASDLSPEDLKVLCGDDGTARQLEDTELEPGDKDDWPVYDMLLLSDIFSHLRSHGVEKDWGLLWLPLAGETWEDSKIEIKRGIHVGLTTFVDTSGECRLLMSLDVKHKIVAKESLHSMLKRESFDRLVERNIKVQTRPGIYPPYSGTLCAAEMPVSISVVQAKLGNRSLIGYSNSRSDKRGSYLNAEPNLNAEAVGLKLYGGRTSDYPPQLLEPAFENDLPYAARTWMTLSPDEKRIKTTSIQGLLSNWRPDFLSLTQSLLKDKVLQAESGANDETEAVSGYVEGIKPRDLLRMGPALPTPRDVVLLPMYPAKYADKVAQLVEGLSGCFQKWTPSIRVAPQDDWIVFDENSAWEDPLETLGENSQEYAVLACFTDLADRRRIKDAAARSNFASQGADLSKKLDRYYANNLFLGINAKLGGQAELCDLAEKGTVFIAYDLSRQRGVSLAVSVVLLGYDGRMASGPDDSRYQRGEALEPDFLRGTLKRSVEEHVRQTDEPIKRVVVYRDGRYRKTEAQEVEACLDAFPDCIVDLVEITKSGPDVLRFIDYKEGTAGNPKPGFVLQLRKKVANLITKAVPFRGLARPILVTHVSGTTPFDQILTEVYKASSLRVYSDRHTRLPINVHVADRRAGAELAGAKYPYRKGVHAA